MSTERGTADVVSVQVRSRGGVGRTERERARERIADALATRHEPVLSAHVRITRLPHPAALDRVVVQVNVALDGRLLRVQVTGASFEAALTEAHDRVVEKLRRGSRDWESLRHRRASRPDPSASDGGHEVSRTKVVPPMSLSVADAADELVLRDHDFFLFIHAGTDSVLERSEDDPDLLDLRQVEPVRPRQADPRVAGPFVLPVMDLEQAAARLALSDARHLAVTDAQTGRAAVVYRRHDDGLGVVTLAP